MDPNLLMLPRQQRYYSKCARWMGALGVRPRGGRAVCAAGAAWMLYSLCVVVDVTHYAFNHLDEDFFMVCHLFASLLLLVFGMCHLLLPYIHRESYGTLFDDFYKEVHLANYHAHDENTMKLLLAKEQMSAKVVAVLTTTVLTAAALFTQVPVLQNILSGAFAGSGARLEPVAYYTVPFDTDHSLLGWAAIMLFAIPACVAAPLMGTYTLVLFFFFVTHLDGQLDILKYNLARIPEPSARIRFACDTGRGRCTLEHATYSAQEEADVRRRLADAVRQHSLILRFRSLIQKVYGELMISMYVFNLVGYCLILLQLTKGLSASTFRYGVVAVCMLAQMAFYSLRLDNTSNQLDDVTAALYATPWHSMCGRNRQTVLCMLLMSQKSGRFTACGLVQVSAPVMLSVLKTSLSYFAFLQSVNH